VDEYLRTFSGAEGVLGAFGVYRAAFTTIDQTTPLTSNKVPVPVVALGGVKGLGAKVQQMVEKVAGNVVGGVVDSSGHFLPEEAPHELVRALLNTLGQDKR
jgi:pimeloyl-ACP methyl ester carboxylesterase